jgi:superfamily II DNA or RNA helicase
MLLAIGIYLFMNNNTYSQCSTDYILKWSNSDLIIIGKENKKLERALTYTKKNLEWDPRSFSRKTVFTQEKVYNKTILDTTNSLVKYQTLQGLLDSIRIVLEKQKLSYQIEDYRIPMYRPKLERMFGFRFNQKDLITKALLCDRSGLVRAPTRYGKTVLITNTINAYPDTKIAVLAPGVNLLPQLVEAIKKYCPDREVKGLFSGSKDKIESDDVTVCSLDSMHKLDKDSYKLILIDEPHAIATNDRAPQIVEFSNARILGFGATTEGRYDCRDIYIEGLIGPVLSEVTYKEAVDMGALCPIHVYCLKIPYVPRNYKQRQTAYAAYLFKNEEFHNTVGEICNNVIPKDWQTLIFIDNEKEAEALVSKIDDGIIAMDKRFKTSKDREQMFKDLKDEKIKRCICSNIYSTGVTIDNLKCEINCDDGGGSILSVQKPGRLAEIKDGKKEGIMIDFIFEPQIKPGFQASTADLQIQKDSFNRLMTYQKKGYIISIFNTIDELKENLNLNNNVK